VRRGELLVLGKYLLFQIPGWAVVGALAFGARGWLGLPDWATWVAVALLVAKDAVLFPFVRHAYAVEAREASEQLRGARGVVERQSDLETWVRVGPELWRARAVDASVKLAPGAHVRVEDVQGLTLRVRAE
jgi:membrane protein implicated in regulation of membrane protease activity